MKTYRFKNFISTDKMAEIMSKIRCFKREHSEFTFEEVILKTNPGLSDYFVEVVNDELEKKIRYWVDSISFGGQPEKAAKCIYDYVVENFEAKQKK